MEKITLRRDDFNGAMAAAATFRLARVAIGALDEIIDESATEEHLTAKECARLLDIKAELARFAEEARKVVTSY